MEENQQQIVYAVHDVEQGEYVQQSEPQVCDQNLSGATQLGRIGKAFRGTAGKRTMQRKSRARSYADKLLGFQNRAKLLTAAGRRLPGDITAFGTDETGAKGKHLIFKVKCRKCSEPTVMRSDNYWNQNRSCVDCAAENRNFQIEKVINVVGHDTEDLAKALESKMLPSQGDRGSYQANRDEILTHFGLKSKAGSAVKGLEARITERLGHTAWAVPFAISRIQCRWKVATWQRLGEEKVLRIAEAVRDHGLKWAAHSLCGGCMATAHVCMRWVLQDFPQIDTLCA